MPYKQRLVIDIEQKFFIVYRTKNTLAAESFNSANAFNKRIETLNQREGIKFIEVSGIAK